MLFLKVPVLLAALALCWQLYAVWCSGTAVKRGSEKVEVHRRKVFVFAVVLAGAVVYVSALAYFVPSDVTRLWVFSLHEDIDAALAVELGAIWFLFNGLKSKRHVIHVKTFTMFFAAALCTGLVVLYLM